MSPSLSLCPGFKQVEAFGPDEDYEDEDEEVSYVVLDLGAIEPTLVPGSTSYRLIVGFSRVSRAFLPLIVKCLGPRHTYSVFTAPGNDIQRASRCSSWN